MALAWAELEEDIRIHYPLSILHLLTKRYLQPLLESCEKELKEYRISGPIQLWTAFLFDKKLRERLVQEFPKTVRKTLEYLTWSRSCLASDLEAQIGEKIVISEELTFYQTDLERHIATDFLLLNFRVKRTFDQSSRKLYGEFIPFLPEQVRKSFSFSFTPPSEFYMIPVPSPETTHYIFQSEKDSLRHLAMCQMFRKQGLIRVSQIGKPLKGALKQLQQMLDLKEFYPKTSNKDLDFLRTELLVRLTLATETETSNTLPSMELLQAMLRSFSEASRFSLLDNLLLHLRGRRNVQSSFYGERDINSSFILILNDLIPLKWISLENLRRYVFLRGIDLELIPPYEAGRYLYFEKKHRHGSAKAYIDSEEVYDQAITNPLLKGSMFVFSSLGLVDLAYNLPTNKQEHQIDKDYLSVFDGLQYVRLTELGAYLTGQQQEYHFQDDPNESVEITLDEMRLMITFHGKAPLKAIVLEQMANKVGENRYKVDFESLLRDCTSRKAVEEKIEKFYQHISSEPPEIWKVFFNRALQQINPMHLKADWQFFKLGDHPELIQLMAKDPILKKYILKAEEYHVAFAQRDFPVIQKRLLALGYLITDEQFIADHPSS